VHYENFIVELGPETADGIRVKVSCAWAGEERGVLRLPCPLEEIVARFAEMAHGGEAAHPAGADRHFGDEPSGPVSVLDGWGADEIGAALFEAVFAEPVRSVLDQCLGRLGHDESQGLRFQLKLDLTDPVQVELHGLPWELLYRAQTGERLGLSRRTPVIRYLELPRAVPPVQRPEALRVLVAAPEPAGVPPLAVSRERENLVSLAASVDGLEVESLETASLGALRRALLEHETHVVHFMGHGQFEPASGRGFLVFERPNGEPERVAAESLAAVLRDFPSVRLVVLNACESARAGSGGGLDSPFTSLAPALMQGGLAAVFAMQRPISDDGAIALSEAFYRRLAAGDPVDAAAAEARQAMFTRAPESVEWAIPVLFLRASGGSPFQLLENPEQSRADLCARSAAQLRSGSYDEAASELRARLVEAPTQGLAGVALGIALARGRNLRRLPFQTAREMHRLFAEALATEDGRRLAAAALLALKAEYFQPGAVREPPPPSAELLGLLAGASLTSEEEQLLGCLPLGDRARRLFEKAGIHGGTDR